MNYFVTGATGFIGRFLLDRLLARKGAQVHVLIRESSRDKFDAIRQRYPDHAAQLHMVSGDITESGVISAEDRQKLAGKINHVFHLAAVYDMAMDDATADKFNVEGTRNVVALVNELGAPAVMHLASSVAVAGGNFVGRFGEDMFDEGQKLDHPYFRTKFESEKIVRDECKVPFRIYRPGAVVGSSETGEMDKIDGPYYFFKTIQKISHAVPKWFPLLGIEGGKVPLAPVDYVASAMDAIAHKPGLDGQCFCLIQSDSPTMGEMAQTIMAAAHGPDFAKNFELPELPGPARDFANTVLSNIPGSFKKQISKAIGVPVSVFGYINNRAVFEDSNARDALKGTGIRCPELKEYCGKLWEYWELHLDLHVKLPRGMTQKVAGKVAMVTGASSGIGFNVAKRLGAAGAKVILVARTKEKLEEAQKIIQKSGGEAYVYPCDLNSLDAIDQMAAQVLNDFGHVDILINNAGRSIRRAVFESLDRFHDYERTMQLNYFGAVRLMMKLLPGMAKRRSGHIINISSIGVLANAARFSAYVASKAALDAFSRCLSAEVKHYNIAITAIYMPLVRTPMIAPTKMYDYVPAWSPEKAANTVLDALMNKPKSVATPLGTAAAVSYALWPKVNDYFLNKGFQLFPSSSAAKGKSAAAEKPTLEQVVFANVFKGEYF